MARSTEVEMTPGRDKITAATSSASLYDNVNNANVTPGKTAKAGESKQKEKQNETCQTTPKTANVGIETVTVGSQVSSLIPGSIASFARFRFSIGIFHSVRLDAIITKIPTEQIEIRGMKYCRSIARKRKALRYHRKKVKSKVKTRLLNKMVARCSNQKVHKQVARYKISRCEKSNYIIRSLPITQTWRCKTAIFST